MFDKLIESEPEGADFKNRRGFFLVSTVVVGILFLTAVVISIYAEDYALGGGRLELEAMLAPADPPAAEPEPARPRPQTAPDREQSSQTSRIINQARPDESQFVPTTISTVPNRYASRPDGDFLYSNKDANALGSGRPDNGPGNGGPGLDSGQTTADKEMIPEPPRVKDPVPAKDVPPAKPVIKTLGVVNSMAKYLPKPPYPPAATMMNVQGKVDVQIMIDETGNVISAKAIDGHPLLRNVAEQASRGAKFTPTYLSNVAVKVTGVIVYDFKKN